MLTTIHGFSSPQILAAYYARAWRSFFCSISDSDRDPGLDYLATTYNGIDPSLFTFRDTPGDYLVFLARFHPEKGAHLAIEIAKRAGVRLKMAGDSARRSVLQRTGRAAYRRRSRCSFSARCEREARDELLAQRARAGAHDDAAGAVRPDADRSDGLRHAGARRAHGFDPGNRRRRRDRLLLRRRGRRGREGAAPWRSLTGALAARRVEADVLGRTHDRPLPRRILRGASR